jgi:signal transduction histidine kinase
MRFFDEPWSQSEVRKVLNLFEGDYRLALEIIDAVPIPIAIVSEPDLQVYAVNAAFRNILKRLPGFAGCPERVAAQIFRDADLSRKAAAVLVSGNAERNVRISFTPTDRVTAAIYPVGRTGRVLIAIEEPSGHATAQQVTANEFRLLQALPVAVYTRDQTGRIRYANPALERLSGFGLPELMSANLADLQVNVADGRVDFARALHATCDLVTKRGDPLPVSISEVRIPEQEQFIGIISRREKATADAEEEDIMQALERVAGQVSHRFNNLLTIILSYSDLISNRFGSVESLRSDIQHVVEAGRKAAELTSQLLAFSRGRPATGTHANVNSVLREFESLLHGVISDDVHLTMDLAPDLGEVAVSAHDLESVLLNLVANANEAIEGPGEIVIKTYAGVPEDPDVPAKHLSFAGKENAVTIAVRDSGGGISEDLLPHVFEPFVTTKPNADGLGLSVVYGIVRTAGGVTTITSIPSVGTTVWVTLPGGVAG